MFEFSEYYEASSLDEATEFLAKNPRAKIIAGGSDILVEIREHPMPDSALVGIGRLNELKAISIDSEGTLSIGSMTTFEQLEKNELIMKYVPMLGESGGTIGGPQLRRVATLGGNICNGAVSADTATSLFDFNTRLVLENSGGRRIVDIKDFYLGPGKTDIKQNEVLTRFLISRADYEGFFGCYIKFSRRKALDIANLGCAVICRIKEGCFSEIRISLGVAAPTPIRCTTAEKFARGLEITEENMENIGKKALEDARPRDSWRASRAFREQLIQVSTHRALREAVSKAGGMQNG